MQLRMWAWRCLVVVVVLGGCTGHRRSEPDAGTPATGFRCVSCLATSDCGTGEECVQYGFDVACAPTCVTGGTACDAGYHCRAYSTTVGGEVEVCVPDVAMCGAVEPPDAGTAARVDSGGAPGIDGGGTPPRDAGPSEVDAAMVCGGLIGPTTAACCTCSAGHTCAANGCFGDWWCNPASCRCQSPPRACVSQDAGQPAPVDAGVPAIDAGSGPPSGVGPMGGTVPRLFFAVLGDSRPPVLETTTRSYPTAIVRQLYADLQALSPRPQFALVTGDYCFAPTASDGAHLQMQAYLGARATYSGTVFYAMGNHECTGNTASNCGPGTTDGVTNNYSAFLTDMLAPLGQSHPYYAVRVNASDGSWTSKFIFAAPNAWDSAQATWLAMQLAIPTTYTFVIDHEPAATTSGPPGLSPLNAALRGVPVTLRIVGHTHTYIHPSANEVVIGLGGAPPAGSFDYGYLTITQLASGDIEVRESDYMTGIVNDVFRVHADGTAAP